MNPLQEMVFIDEIVLQAKIAQRAAERLQITHDNYDEVEVWSSIQLILIAAANVSKILWTSKKDKSRSEKLRKRLNVDKSNILSNRKFRNHFEHYDERIEDSFKNNTSAVYTDLAMNPSMYGNIIVNDDREHNKFVNRRIHRGYNTVDNTLEFRGELLDLGAVLSALEEIKLKCAPYTLI